MLFKAIRNAAYLDIKNGALEKLYKQKHFLCNPAKICKKKPSQHPSFYPQENVGNNIAIIDLAIYVICKQQFFSNDLQITVNLYFTFSLLI